MRGTKQWFRVWRVEHKKHNYHWIKKSQQPTEFLSCSFYVHRTHNNNKNNKFLGSDNDNDNDGVTEEKKLLLYVIFAWTSICVKVLVVVVVLQLFSRSFAYFLSFFFPFRLCFYFSLAHSYTVCSFVRSPCWYIWFFTASAVMPSIFAIENWNWVCVVVVAGRRKMYIRFLTSLSHFIQYTCTCMLYVRHRYGHIFIATLLFLLHLLLTRSQALRITHVCVGLAIAIDIAAAAFDIFLVCAF